MALLNKTFIFSKALLMHWYGCALIIMHDQKYASTFPVFRAHSIRPIAGCISNALHTHTYTKVRVESRTFNIKFANKNWNNKIYDRIDGKITEWTCMQQDAHTSICV